MEYKDDMMTHRDGGKPRAIRVWGNIVSIISKDSWQTRIESLYPHMPVLLQNLFCTAYGWDAYRKRRGPYFRGKLNELIASEGLMYSEIEDFQNRALVELLEYAYANVPYYRNLFDKNMINPNDIRSRSDLQTLPYLSKEDVRNHFESLLGNGINPSSLVLGHTSGTTGKSLHYYLAKNQAAFMWAIWWRHRRRFGLREYDWHANFTGKLVVPPQQKEPPFWRWNLPMRQIIFNMQHMVPDHIESIVNFLNSRKLAYYSGYPSIIHAFCLAAMDRGLKLTAKPRYVVTGAENVLDSQRKDIESFIGAPVIDQYGFSEGCGNASQCPEGVYHEDFEMGILECVDGETLEDGSIRGKIVCTGFINPDFPFIRYEVGDIGVWAKPGYRCPCGRESRVILRIEGRVDDYIITPEGRRIMRFDYIFKDTQSVKEVQVVQSQLGEIVLKVVRRPDYSERDENYIREMVERWISPSLQVSFNYVDQIEREGAGKFRAVKSLLKRAV